MRRRSRSLVSSRAGFTLVELMIVVAIIGVLAALAIYGVARYLKHAKTAEALRFLGSLETGERAQYQLDSDVSGAGFGPFVHAFCPELGCAMGSPCSGGAFMAPPPGAKVLPNPTSFRNDPWKCVKFTINEPTYYAIDHAVSGTGPEAWYRYTARGDLDGNGTTSEFKLLGAGSTSGEAVRTSLTVKNEDE